jgi:PAS domain S-box-containing protein
MLSIVGATVSRVVGLVERAFERSWVRVLFGLGAVATAFCLRLLLHPLTGNGAPFVLFFGAMLVTSLLAGAGAGLLVLLMSLPLAAIAFAIPAGATLQQAAFQALLYAVDGLIVVHLTRLTRNARRRARDIIELSPEAYFQATLDGRLVDVNQSACRLLGYQRGELLGKAILDLVPSEDAPGLVAVERELLTPGVTPGSVHAGEWTLLHKDGAAIAIEVGANILPGGRWQAFARDVGERKRAEAERERTTERLRQSEEQFRLVFEAAPIGVALVALDGRFLRVNRAFCDMLGYSSSELEGLSYQAITARADLAASVELRQRVFRGEATTYRLEKRYLHKNGGLVDVCVNGSLVHDRAGAPLHYIAHIEDITERKRLEREQRLLAEVGVALAASLDYEQTLTAVAHLAVKDFADWSMVEVTEASGDLRRLKVVSADPRKAAVAAHLERFPLDRSRPHLLQPVVEQREPLLLRHVTDEDIEAAAQTPEHLASLRAIEATSLLSVPLLLRGSLLGTLSFISTKPSRRFGAEDLRLARALAERAAVAIENALLYGQSLYATGLRDQVLGVVAHDLRNPLSTIALHASALGRPGPQPDRRNPRHKQAIERATRRMARLIDDLLDVAVLEAGQLKVERAPLAARELLFEAVEMQQELAAAASIELRVQVAAEVPGILGDHDRLLQVFENLIGNALKFTEAGGRVVVGGARGDDEVLFWVADTGRGMSSDDLARVFDRFWQASARSGRLGAGLGLPITKGIVEAHGGRIWAESAPGQGSTFFFSIPTGARANEGLPLVH